MAAAFAIVKRRPDLRETIVDMTADTAYPVNGYPVAAKDLGLLSIDSVDGYARSAHGLYPKFDPTNSKILVFQAGTSGSPLLECTASDTDVTASVIFRLECKGDPLL